MNDSVNSDSSTHESNSESDNGFNILDDDNEDFLFIDVSEVFDNPSYCKNPPSYQKIAKDEFFNKVGDIVKKKVNERVNKQVVLFFASYMINCPYVLLSLGYDCLVTDTNINEFIGNIIVSNII